MHTLSIGRNCFTGSLPERGLQTMRAVVFLDVMANSLTGTLPDDSFKELGRLEALLVDDNGFEGDFTDPQQISFV
eukprot:6400202-Amphidinium_carterae.1